MDNFEKISALVCEAEEKLSGIFADIDRISFKNTKKIMDSFKAHRVSETMFNATSGYGYDDHGRETLDKIWADVMDAEAAFVRHSIVNGTQALTIGLFGLLRPGDIMFSIAGKPYDTLDEVIGNSGEAGNGKTIAATPAIAAPPNDRPNQRILVPPIIIITTQIIKIRIPPER